MIIWHQNYELEDIKKNRRKNMLDHLGIELTALTENTITGTMPVDERTIQPFGILHGGANCVLAESLGSIAANLTLDPSEYHAVGLSIHTNHIKAVRNGHVTGVARPVHIGKTTQVWSIETFNHSGALTSRTSLTMAVVKKKLPQRPDDPK